MLAAVMATTRHKTTQGTVAIALALLSLAVVAVGCGSDGDGAPDSAPVKRALVDNTRWTLLAPAADPFFDSNHPKAKECGDVDLDLEVVGPDTWFEVDTSGCAYATVSQPIEHAIPQGAELFVRIWHFKLTAAEADYRVALAVGEGADRTIIYEKKVVAPNTKSALLFATVKAPRSFAKGSPVYWHISNHGDNSWRFIEFSATY